MNTSMTAKPATRSILFEPRNAPMQLRQIDELTVELYQAPLPRTMAWRVACDTSYSLTERWK